jgi:hypothetical protein
VNLIEARFASNAPANAYGVEPFLRRGDFSTPNGAYFDHAEFVIEAARARDLLVLLTPAYLGARGAEEGWYQTLIAAPPDALLDYGRFLGRRFNRYPNLLFVHGGDYSPPNKEPTRAIARGLRDEAPAALATAHCGSEDAALSVWRGEPWLDLNSVYTYANVAEACARQFQAPEGMPLFFIEGGYENDRARDERRLRTQAYHALLSGAFGHVFGNAPIWSFGTAGSAGISGGWRAALDSRGARSMGVLKSVFTSVQWDLLVPDLARAFLIEGASAGADELAVAAVSSDRAFGLVYVPSARSLRLDLRRLAGSQIRATWIDPSTGSRQTPLGSPFSGDQSRSLTTPGSNASGFSDWILLVESV